MGFLSSGSISGLALLFFNLFERLRLSKFHVADKILINLKGCSSAFLSFSNFLQIIQRRGLSFQGGGNSVKQLNYLIPHTASRFHFIDITFLCFYKPLRIMLAGPDLFWGNQVYERVKLLNLPSMCFNFKNLKQLGSISLIRFQQMLHD